jgi:NAD-dependent SIR2 family protein deacetylase
MGDVDMTEAGIAESIAPQADVIDIPSQLLAAVGNHGGGRLVIVMGAGCSVEAPSSLPASDRCSREVWQELRDDEILGPDDCANSDDLSAVADAVYEKCGSQVELVKRLPARFRYAEPNDGTLLAAALLREGVAHHVITLNFDLTFSTALVRVGAHGDVAVLNGPEDHEHMGTHNLIYLHRNVEASDPETLVLRTAALDQQWREGWEEVVVRMALVAPIVVFAGLGTKVGALVESSQSIKQALGGSMAVVQVDIGRREDSAYADALGVSEGNFVQAGWSEFMDLLGRRVVKAYLQMLRAASRRLIDQAEVAPEDQEPLFERLVAAGLLYLGELRARWTLDPSMPYLTATQADPEHIADLLLCVALLERVVGARAAFVERGLVELSRDGHPVALIALGTGRGVSPWLAAESRLRTRPSTTVSSALRPTLGVLAHVRKRPETLAPPENIVPSRTGDNIVTGVVQFPVLELDDLRRDPTQVLALVKAA